MSRTVDVVVQVDLDLVEAGTRAPARCVTAVGNAPWNDTYSQAEVEDIEQAITVVLDALGQNLADVTGELEGGQR